LPEPSRAHVERQLARALRLFQIEHGLPVTGEDDPPTRSKLLELHGA